MNYKQQLSALGGLGFSAFAVYVFGKKCLFTGKKNTSNEFNLFHLVDTGHKAFLFNKFSGVKMTTMKEGLHFRIPFLENPVIYNVKT